MNLIYFQALSNFSIKSQANIIDFVVRIWIRAQIQIKKVDLMMIQVRFQSKFRTKSIQLPKLTLMMIMYNLLKYMLTNQGRVH